VIGLVLAALLAVTTLQPGSAPAAGGRDQAEQRVTAPSLRPEIVWKPIPYGDRRKRQMAAYSLRHYGVRRWRLTSPPVIVQHYTDGTTWQGAWNHFASNSRHNGELPGTCTHFLIHTDGTIYQLVDLDVRCRHAVGMNHVSIGVEHVGTSDRMVLSNDAQMESSLALTTWLMARFDVNVGNVVGHRETLESPYRYELYPDWKCLAHADFPRWAMKEYRTRLREVLAASGVPHGPGPVWVDNGC
jgi:N-acetyl-anhydromuramyl-L-alanine amidase AmpD